jgi:hypothetical protein
MHRWMRDAERALLLALLVNLGDEPGLDIVGLDLSGGDSGGGVDVDGFGGWGVIVRWHAKVPTADAPNRG